MKIKLNPNDLTFGDLEDFEQFTGKGLMDTFDTVGTNGNVQALDVKSVVGLLWISGRQQDPSFTLEQARKVKISELEIEVGEEPDPTSGGDSPKPSA